MTDFFLGCFAFGLMWSVLAFALSGLHVHGHGLHLHGHGAHLHSLPLGPGHGLRGGARVESLGTASTAWAPYLLSTPAAALALSWAGGCGYLLLRHAQWGLWLVLLVAAVAGLCGAMALGTLLRFLQARDHSMRAADHDMVGVLGRISSPIREGGTGEMIFIRDGSRKLAFARSETGDAIERGHEVVVTEMRHGIAFVRSWASLEDELPPLAERPNRNLGTGAEDAPHARQ